MKVLDIFTVWLGKFKRIQKTLLKILKNSRLNENHSEICGIWCSKKCVMEESF